MTPSRKLIYAGLLAALLLASAGCNKKPVQAAPPVSTAPADTSAQPVEEKKTEETKTETKTEPPPELVVPPPRTPTRTSPPPAKPPEPEPRPAPPTMTPRMTPQQQAELEKKTRDDISTAERNLTRANGRSLNAAQKDMVEKIRGFLSQSRDAIRANDWVRAQNLAQKAQVLSVELVNSL